ncbi:MAG: site-specific integrase [Actinomycetota bacterium]|nr:site-specific integrase [Actinomycetota bacterium]
MAPLSRKRQLALQRSVAEEWLDEQISPNTRAAYRSDLTSFGRWCAQRGGIVLTADTTTLVAFQSAREAAGDSASTIRRKWSALSSFYDFAIRNDATDVNPALGVDRPQVASGDPSPTPRLPAGAVANYRSLAAALDPRLDALVALLVVDGLKVSEALALDISDVRGRPPITSVLVRRRGVSKRVILDAESARAVRRCAAKRKSGPLFASGRISTSGQSRRLTRFGADHLIRQLNTDETTEHVTANVLRRFHITHHAEDKPLDEVRERAGLADVRSIRRYMVAEDETLDAQSRAHPTLTEREPAAKAGKPRRGDVGVESPRVRRSHQPTEHRKEPTT